MKRRLHFILVSKIVKFYVSYENISLILLFLITVDRCRLCPDSGIDVCFCFFPSVCDVMHMQQGYKSVLFLPPLVKFQPNLKANMYIGYTEED